MSDHDQQPFLELHDIVKKFPGTLAVDNVSMTAFRGHVHGLVGENGAGKSTLVRVIGGVHRPDSGTISIGGTTTHFRDYSDARRAGVGVVYQNLSLLTDISVAENVIMGIWPRKRGGLIDWAEVDARAQAAFHRVGLDIDPHTLVSSLPIATRQLVEIAKVLSQDPEIIIFDEPTAPLSRAEVDRLFAVIDSLRQQDKLVIFVSHRLDEVLGICDTITVMKDAKHVITARADEFDENKLITAMVGREITEVFPEKAHVAPDAPVVFGFSGSVGASQHETSFTVQQGEVIGVGGLQGQGQVALLNSIFGLEESSDIRISIHGEPWTIRSPRDAMKAGIALIPENRIQEGIFSGLSVGQNLAAATLDRRKLSGFIRKKAERIDIQRSIDQLSVRLSSPTQPIDSLSGGNMQKVVVGKWLLFKPRVVVAIEPTQGVDVGTKQQMYELFRELAVEGITVIVFTSDLLELIGLCDRVLVMNRGFLTGNLRGDQLNEEMIMTAAVSRQALREAGAYRD